MTTQEARLLFPPATDPVVPVELCVVVPTYNERDNIGRLLERLERCLVGVAAFEIIVVDDDSPDRTAAAVRAIAQSRPWVRCLQRIGRRGLSSACIEGMLATSAPCLAVIDADLQHDETLLPRMLELLRRGEADLVVGSRYAESALVPGWDERRWLLSRFATRLGQKLLGVELSDPMSGFFMLRREAFEAVVRRLSGIGFKLLLDILVSAPTPLRVKELAYSFRPREVGASKLDTRVAVDFALMLLDKLTGGLIPARFVLFAVVGAAGLVVHLAVLGFVFRFLGEPFVAGQAAATLVAMSFNYALNNELTYRDRRLRGWRWLEGWGSFVLACGIGALANVGVAAQLHAERTPWLLSALAGVAVGAVWNYVVTALYVWKR
ncbi:glycosyltransferase [Benzoatithermus flavus]|uniref:Glycosyltransferase family 2 protein n=1 Tax=Benzoatithermus flavus TaxID=3108223 RepID=A0ABU8XP56_9PROT